MIDDNQLAEEKIKEQEHDRSETFYLACGFLVYYAITSMIEMLGYGKFDPETKGMIIGAVITIVTFYFGSSKGERKVTK